MNAHVAHHRISLLHLEISGFSAKLLYAVAYVAAAWVAWRLLSFASLGATRD